MLHDFLVAVCILVILLSMGEHLWLIALAAGIAILAIGFDLIKSSQGRHTQKSRDGIPRCVASNIHAPQSVKE